MDKYYVIYQSNGSLQINSITEWGTLAQAIGKFHDVCALMWKTAEVTYASVVILDNNMVPVNPYREEIHKAEAQVEAEPAKSTKKSAKSE